MVKTLQKQTEELKRQLENEKHDTALLLEALKEQTRYKDHSDIVAPSLPQEKIYPLEGLKEMKARLDKLEVSPAQMRPLIKTDYTFDGSEDLDRQMSIKETPFSATKLAKLKKDFSRSLKESETEYVWRVSFTGGDQIVLMEREAEGYCGPGVFLTAGNNHDPWSLTQKAAYWTIDPLERGDPLPSIGTVDHLVENSKGCLSPNDV